MKIIAFPSGRVIVDTNEMTEYECSYYWGMSRPNKKKDPIEEQEEYNLAEEDIPF